MTRVDEGMDASFGIKKNIFPKNLLLGIFCVAVHEYDTYLSVLRYLISLSLSYQLITKILNLKKKKIKNIRKNNT